LTAAVSSEGGGRGDSGEGDEGDEGGEGGEGGEGTAWSAGNRQALRPVISRQRLVLVPSYNTGAQLLQTVLQALAVWRPVWVIIDGSSDGSARLLDSLLDPASPTFEPGLRLIELPLNRGKGAALLVGMTTALHEGYSHFLAMDADGQHPADMVPTFMAASEAEPWAMVLGRPVFDASAPALRVRGRRISNWWVNLETFHAGIDDSLFGFRVYPIAPLVQIMHGRRGMRRFDFDPEAVVRLCWHGVKPINISAPVRYLTTEQGGVSHFNYYRDNALLTVMHLRLLGGFLVRALIRWLRRH
jgi:glycosyltransferase involved in cell wall biosynthesis